MIEKARALGVYDRLEQGDIVEFLGGSEERWDLVLAADVFIYVGDLEPVFARLERAMAEGVFCFSVESLEGDGAGLRLLPSLRYAHSEAYLERLASQHGFEVVAMKHAPVREEQGAGGRGALRDPAQAARPRQSAARVRPEAALAKQSGLTPCAGGCGDCSHRTTAHDRSPFPVSAGRQTSRAR